MKYISRIKKECGPMMALGHDLEHSIRVQKLAVRIGRKEGADLLVLAAAALMHDLARGEELKNPRIDHAQRSAEIASEILKKIGFPKEKIGKVVYAIKAHRFKKGILPETKEAKILQDADKLDALGAIGIMRCFTFGGARGRKDYNPRDPFCKNRKPQDAYSLDHFYQKLFRLKESIHTPTAKKIAEKREKIMKFFLRELEKEIEGKG